MKTTSLPSVILLAALAAAVLLPISVEFAATLLMLAGFAAVLVHDYSREIKPLAVQAQVSAFPTYLQKACVPVAA